MENHPKSQETTSTIPPQSPKTTDPTNNPYPTTFVQADASSFKQVVQMLTGSSETVAAVAAPKPPPVVRTAAVAAGPKKPSFKLYERRSSLKTLKVLSPLMPSSPFVVYSPRKQSEILSPSMLDFPSLALSPVTPLIADPFNRPSSPALPHPSTEAARWAEDRAIAEKGFYLHPSPRATHRDGEIPKLLPLFPMTSPKVANNHSC